MRRITLTSFKTKDSSRNLMIVHKTCPEKSSPKLLTLLWVHLIFLSSLSGRTRGEEKWY